MNSNFKARIKTVLLFIAVLVCGSVLAGLRMNILFGEYDASIDLYPKNSANAVFETALLIISVLLIFSGLLFCSKNTKYRPGFSGVAVTFSHSLLGLCFLALGFSRFIGSKLEGRSIGRFDSVLIILSLVCAASFFMEAFSKDSQLGFDAVTVMMLSRPICCLFISFYFYFDATTVIHNSNKKMATLFFALVLLTLLYCVKFRTESAKMPVFVSLTALSLCYGVMYAVPNLVWFFMHGEELLLSVFFDITSAALSIWCGVCLLTIKQKTTFTPPSEPAPISDIQVSGQEQQDVHVPPLRVEPVEDSEIVSEPDPEPEPDTEPDLEPESGLPKEQNELQ